MKIYSCQSTPFCSPKMNSESKLIQILSRPFDRAPGRLPFLRSQAHWNCSYCLTKVLTVPGPSDFAEG